MQGFFSIKTTPLGANQVLLEETEEGIISDLFNTAKEWLHEKFVDIRGWEPNAIDNERVVWIRCHGIPVHAWNDGFFASLARNFGEYLGVDEATRTKTAMDVARIRLRSNGYDVFNAVVTANINGSLFHIKLVEEWCGPIQCLESVKIDKNTDYSSGSDGSADDGPPLFTAEGGWEFVESGDELEGTKCGGDGETENEADSVVQETIEVPNESVHEPNDLVGGMFNVEKQHLNMGEREVVAAGSCNTPHVSNSIASGGVQDEGNAEVAVEVDTNKPGGSSRKRGCKKKGSLKRPKSLTKRSGPEKRKKKEKRGRKKKKKAETQFLFEDGSEGEQNTEKEKTPSPASSQAALPGVVRSSFNLFAPSASLSVNSGGSSSQMESVGDSGILMGNVRFEKEMEKLQAEKLWALAKEKLGVTAEEDDEVYIEKIREMEARDKLVQGRMETMPSSR